MTLNHSIVRLSPGALRNVKYPFMANLTRVVTPDRDPSMCEIETFDHLHCVKTSDLW